MNYLFIWLSIACITLIFELKSFGYFFFFSFFVGALIAASSTFFMASLKAQIAVFLGASALIMVLIKVINLCQSPKKGYQSNIYGLVGKTGVVISEIAPLKPGSVKIGGEVWRAEAKQSLIIGDIIEVRDVAGSRLIVDKPVKGK